MPRRQYDFRSGELADDDRVLPEPGRVIPFRSSRRGEGWARYREARRQLREYNAERQQQRRERQDQAEREHRQQQQQQEAP
jgi:hypothetical protein